MSDSKPQIPMLSNKAATAAGVLPVLNRPVRFAVGDPNGLTSNSWIVKSHPKSGIYIACRDNFKETKVSLHPQGMGDWRMAFVSKDVAQQVTGDTKREWSVWTEPPELVPNLIVAFHLYFPTSEIAVTPEMRTAKLWKDVMFIEAGPPGKITIVTLFITIGDLRPTHESEPSFVLASFDAGDNRYAKLVAHADPEGNIPELIVRSVGSARESAKQNGVELPSGSFGYFFGHLETGARFIFGARM